MIYTIDIPRRADYPRLLSIWEASVRATHYFVSAEKIPLLKRLIQEHQYFHKAELFCVRNTKGDIAGFAGTSGNCLDMLFLDPSIIGTGAGKALMRYALDIKGAVYVDVNEQNTQAYNFYKSFGFEIIERTETDENGLPFPLLRLQLLTKIRELQKEEPAPYNLLLLADEEMQAINQYIHLSTIYVAERGEQIIGVYTLYPINKKTVEVKTIAVSESWQNQGLGKRLLKDAAARALDQGYQTLLIGTPSIAQKQLAIYQRAGFEPFEVKKDFFINNYVSSIFEDGVQIRDMVMLKKTL